MKEQIKLSQINVDQAYQPRKSLNQEIIGDYAELLKEGHVFPPVTLYRQGDNYILAAGFHRLEAHKLNESTYIDAIIKEGTSKDILLDAIQSNNAHGVRYTNEDKRRIVALVLSNHECISMTDNQIGKICGVSNHLVKAIREELFPEQAARTEVIVHKGNISYVMKKSVKSSEANLEKSIKKKINSISCILDVVIYAYKNQVTLPDEVLEKIESFVNWYTTRNEEV